STRAVPSCVGTVNIPPRTASSSHDPRTHAPWPPVKLIPMPRAAMRTAGLFAPAAREMAEMDYQWYSPFLMDASKTADTFGLTATDLDIIINNQVSAATA
ncbi:hypothetical protein ABZ474_49445, partial [Streptomyces mirabilis]